MYKNVAWLITLLMTSGLALAQTYDLAVQDPRIRVIYGADGRRADLADELGDNLISATTGDINGDDIPDLALVATGDDGPDETRFDAGAILIFFGPIEPGSTVDLRTDVADLSVYLNTDEGTGLFDVVIADLNHDGDDDLVFGSVFAAQPGRTRAGEVLAFFGPLAPGVIDLQLTPPDWSLIGRDGTEVSLKGDHTSPVGIADIDGDGFNDLIADAWLSDGPANSRQLAGELFVVFGGPGSTLAGPAMLDLVTLTDYFIAFGAGSGDSIDIVAIADVNGDSVPDIVFSGESNGPANDRDDAGSIGVIFGGSHLRPAAGAIREWDFATDAPDLLIHGREASDLVRSAAVGDYNGDGVSDLIVSAWVASGPANLRFGAGESYLLIGGSTLATTPSPQSIDLASPGAFDSVIYGADEGDLSGVVVGTANANNDGLDDIVINSPFADGPANSRTDAGEVYVVFGRDEFPAEIDLRDPVDLHFIGVEAGVPNNDEGPGDTLFFDGAADLTGDGLDELLLMAPRGDGPINDRPRAGEVFVFFSDDASDVDGDGDGLPDSVDNCTNIANPAQTDTNGDGIGNACDPDIGGIGGPGADDCLVNFLDLNILKAAFFSIPTSPTWNEDADFTGASGDPDGIVNLSDLARMRTLFFSPPGPSASDCVPVT